MNDTTRELGGALGVAVLGSIVASRYSSRIAPLLASLSAKVKQPAGRSVSAAVNAGHSIAGADGKALVSAARHAYVSGMHLATLVGSAIAVTASIIVFRLMPGTRPNP